MDDDSKDDMDAAIAEAIEHNLAAFINQSDLEADPGVDPAFISPLQLFSTQDLLPPPLRLDSDDMAQPFQHPPGTMTTSSYPPPDIPAIKPERQQSSPPRDRDQHRRGYQACQPCRQR